MSLLCEQGPAACSHTLDTPDSPDSMLANGPTRGDGSGDRQHVPTTLLLVFFRPSHLLTATAAPNQHQVETAGR